jgi:tetratricopeptide (TPR) repeat protein
MRQWLLVLVLFLSLPVFAERWLKVPGPDFTVYTNAGDSRGRDVVARLEQVRKIFPVLLPRSRWTVTAPLTVVAFKEHKDLLAVAPLYEGKPIDVGALYLKGDDRNFIVLDVNSDSEWRPVYHEYAPFMLEMNLPRTPLWFDEGMADYFSTVKFESNQFTLGLAPPGYLELLDKPSALSLEQVLNVTPFSREYHSMVHGRGEFYARSWLLAHYLLSNKKLAQAMQYFDLTMNHRVAISQAVQQAFGMTLKELSDAMKEHRGRIQQTTQSYPAPPVEKLSYSIDGMKDSQVRALLADVHLHSPDHQAQAETEFRQLVSEEGEHPNAAAHGGLGYLALRKGDLPRAQREFEKAGQAGSDDAYVWYLAAYADYKANGLEGRPSAELIELNTNLDHALQLDPNHAEALNLKALVLASAANPAEAIRLLIRACELRPRNEQFKSNLAQQYVRARKFDEARAVLERLQRSDDPAVAAAAEKMNADAKRFQESKLAQYAAESKPESYTSPQWRPKPGQAQDPELEKLNEKDRANTEQESPDDRPIKFAKVTLMSATCSADGTVKLKVRFPKKIMDVVAPDKDKLTLIGADKFDCGWKQKPVAINYRVRSTYLADLVSLEIK